MCVCHCEPVLRLVWQSVIPGLGERILTPVCALAQNDRVFTHFATGPFLSEDSAQQALNPAPQIEKREEEDNQQNQIVEYAENGTVKLPPANIETQQ